MATRSGTKGRPHPSTRSRAPPPLRRSGRITATARNPTSTLSSLLGVQQPLPRTEQNRSRRRRLQRQRPARLNLNTPAVPHVNSTLNAAAAPVTSEPGSSSSRPTHVIFRTPHTFTQKPFTDERDILTGNQEPITETIVAVSRIRSSTKLVYSAGPGYPSYLVEAGRTYENVSPTSLIEVNPTKEDEAEEIPPVVRMDTLRVPIATMFEMVGNGDAKVGKLKGIPADERTGEKCGVCLDYWRERHVTKCGQILCPKCFSKLSEESCPFCRDHETSTGVMQRISKPGRVEVKFN